MTIIPIRPDVAPPPDATRIDGWAHVFNDHESHRFFYGTQRGAVRIEGYQNSDGTIRGRWFYLDSRALECEELDAAAARELARALTATADELDEFAS